MNYAIHVPEDTETESRFRGIISNKIKSYYIINEIASKPYMKILTGVKLNPNKEERKKEIEDLLKKRNELLASMGISVPSTNETETNEMSNDYPRHTR